MLSWPRALPLEEEPAEIVRVIADNSAWLAEGHVPKLFISGDPGQVRGRVAEAIRAWSNQTEITVKGRKLLQEDSPDEIGAAIAEFVRTIRHRSTVATPRNN